MSVAAHGSLTTILGRMPYHVARLGGTTGHDEGDLLAGAVLDIVGGRLTLGELMRCSNGADGEETHNSCDLHIDGVGRVFGIGSVS